MMTIHDEMVRQSQDMKPENFRCNKCKNYKGNLACEKNIFIAFEGANMAMCRYYELGRKCPHCGRVS